LHALAHPAHYKAGARVLVLRARNKDGADEPRTISRASFSATEFDRQLESLIRLLRPGERVYASAGARDVSKAIRLFKERQLAADYDPDSDAFYRCIESRWLSCLMDTRCQAEKIWLFDCDSAEDASRVRQELAQRDGLPASPYEYQTKSGMHFVVVSFDKSKLSDHTRALIHDNALMLWAYS
jgi:hypothetical protein